MRTIEDYKQKRKLYKKWGSIFYRPISVTPLARLIATDIVDIRPLSPPTYTITMDPVIYGTGGELSNPRSFLDVWMGKYSNLWTELKPVENLIIWEQKNIFNINGFKN